jgi:hypothetical protein
MKLVRGLHNLIGPKGGTDARSPYAWPPFGRMRADRGELRRRALGPSAHDSCAASKAKELGCESAVLVFEPSSKEFIDPVGAPPRLTRWREKYVALAALGVDRLVTLRFDDECGR